MFKILCITNVNEEEIHWLRTDHARGTPNVNVERLIEVLTGVFDLEQRGLTFEEYLRVLQIREGLDMRQMASIASNIRVVSIVLGILLIFYSMLLIPFYYFDVFNNVVDSRIWCLDAGCRARPH